MSAPLEPGALPPCRVHIVRCPNEAAAVARGLEGAEAVGFDSETPLAMSSDGGRDGMPTNPCDPRMAPALVQLATDTEAWVFDCCGVTPLHPQDNPEQRAKMLDALKPALLNPRKRLLAHNFSFDAHTVALRYGKAPTGLLCDTLHLEHLLRPDEFTIEGAFADRSLKGLCEKRYGEVLPDYRELFTYKPPGGKKQTMGALEVLRTFGGADVLLPYAAKDPWLTVRLFRDLEREARAMPWKRRAGGTIWDLYCAIERPLVHVLVSLERRGIRINTEKLEALRQKARRQEAGAVDEWIKLVQELGIDRRLGKMPQLSSNPDLCRVFGALDLVAPDYKLDAKRIDDADFDERLKDHFEVFGESLPTVRDAGVVDAETLKHWGHPLADVVLTHREAAKTRGTYCEPIARMVAMQPDGKLRCNIRQAGPRTGRLAMRNPNGQNITSKGLGAALRDCFEAPEGYEIFVIDQAAIEARLAGILSGDPLLLRVFREGIDPHSQTAQLIFSDCRGLSLNDIKTQKPKRRKAGKIVNYLSLYGGGAKKLAWFAGLELAEAKAALAQYWASYATLKRHIEKTRERARVDGCVYTIVKRPIQLNGFYAEEEWKREQAERQAFNSVIQGSSADIIKCAMLCIERDEELRALGVEMLLTVHDELVFMAPKGTYELVKARIDDIVSRPLWHLFGLELPIETPAELDRDPSNSGSSWWGAKDEQYQHNLNAWRYMEGGFGYEPPRPVVGALRPRLEPCTYAEAA